MYTKKRMRDMMMEKKIKMRSEFTQKNLRGAREKMIIKWSWGRRKERREMKGIHTVTVIGKWIITFYVANFLHFSFDLMDGSEQVWWNYVGLI